MQLAQLSLPCWVYLQSREPFFSNSIQVAILSSSLFWGSQSSSLEMWYGEFFVNIPLCCSACTKESGNSSRGKETRIQNTKGGDKRRMRCRVVNLSPKERRKDMITVLTIIL